MVDGEDASSTAEDARTEMDAARREVMDSETEIQSIKSALRTNTSTADGAGAGAKNSFRISALKVKGLPDSAKPTFKLQLSSPVEELSLTKLYDPLIDLDEAEASNDGSVIKFEDVETAVATLTLSAYDAEIHLGSSASLDVSPLCDFDVLEYHKTAAAAPGADIGEAAKKEEKKVAAKVTELDVAIVADEQSGTTKEEEKPVDVDVAEEDDDDKIASILVGGEMGEETTGDKDKDKKEKGDSDEDIAPSDAAASPSDDAAVDEKDEEAIAKTDEQQDKPVVVEEEKPATEEAVVAEDEENGDETSGSMGPPRSGTDIDEVDGEPSASAKAEEECTADAAKAPQSSGSGLLATVCTVTLRVEYTPSKKDQQEKLYDLLNKASKRKALSIDRLRKSAAAVSRSKQVVPKDSSSPTGASDGAVKSGFLNKKAKKKGEPGFLSKVYDRVAGPNSLIVRLFPVAKNYILFVGVVALMHFKGDSLALPAPI